MHLLVEEQVGISQYCGNHHGFKGIIKQRFSDFLVNEITPNGDVVHLDDLQNVPYPPGAESNDDNIDGQDVQDTTENEVIPKGISQEVIDQLKELDKNGIKSDNNKDGATTAEHQVVIPIADIEKSGRKPIHDFIQHRYSCLQSRTDDIEGIKSIVVTVGTVSSLKRERKRREPKRKKYFTYFHLYKENVDTMYAVSNLAFKLRIKASDILYAGNKDKRAITVQRLCIANMMPKRIVDASKSHRNILVGNFSFSDNSFSLGDLSGNAFKIVLREVNESDSVISTAVESLRNTGAINYYGLQRFGTRSGHTHTTGKYMLASKWEEAIASILETNSYDMDDKSQIIKSFTDGDISVEEAISQLKKKKCFRGHELNLLCGIAELGGTDFLGPLMRIPRNGRTLYLHAYQAYLWNRVVSKRIQKYGLKVIPGDLVACVPDCEVLGEGDTEEEEEETLKKENNPKVKLLQSSVRAITEEEASTIDLSEVIIPSVGYAVKLPNNEMADWYAEMLKEDGLTIDSLDHKQKNFAVCGVYRRMMIYPKNLKYRTEKYSDVTMPLVENDRHVIFKDFQKKKEETLADEAPEIKKAVVLEFHLPPSAYATMVLREILRVDTQPHNLSQLISRKVIETKETDSSDGVTKRKLETEDEASKKQRVE